MDLQENYTDFGEIEKENKKFIQDFFPIISFGTVYYNELYTIAYTNATRDNYKNSKIVLVSFDSTFKSKKVVLSFEEYIEYTYNKLSALERFSFDEQNINDLEFRNIII